MGKDMEWVSLSIWQADIFQVPSGNFACAQFAQILFTLSEYK